MCPKKTASWLACSWRKLVATEGKSPGKILKELEKQTGPFFTDRINIHIEPQKKDMLLSRLSEGLKYVGAFKVKSLSLQTGSKFALGNDEWVHSGPAARASFPLLYRSEIKEKPGSFTFGLHSAFAKQLMR